jgi:hypothetical protein
MLLVKYQPANLLLSARCSALHHSCMPPYQLRTLL